MIKYIYGHYGMTLISNRVSSKQMVKYLFIWPHSFFPSHTFVQTDLPIYKPTKPLHRSEHQNRQQRRQAINYSSESLQNCCHYFSTINTGLHFCDWFGNTFFEDFAYKTPSGRWLESNRKLKTETIVNFFFIQTWKWFELLHVNHWRVQEICWEHSGVAN